MDISNVTCSAYFIFCVDQSVNAHNIITPYNLSDWLHIFVEV
jgi:hypothetical protein